jgi:hypothetical protein
MGQWQTLPLFPLGGPPGSDPFQIRLQPTNLFAYKSTVSLELGFALTLGSKSACLSAQVTPGSSQSRQRILEPG